VWRSADGVTWEPLPGDDVTTAGIADLAATPNGWVALVDATGSPAIASSVDGTEWTSVALPKAPDERPDGLAPGQDGWLIRGDVGSCGFLSWGSCTAGPASWWSADGTAWGRMPLIPPLDGPPIPEVAAGPRGFVAWGAGEAWSSPDGWDWTPLGGPEDQTFGPAAVAATEDRIVLVGSTTSADGERTVGRAFLGVVD